MAQATDQLVMFDRDFLHLKRDEIDPGGIRAARVQPRFATARTRCLRVTIATVAVLIDTGPLFVTISFPLHPHPHVVPFENLRA